MLSYQGGDGFGGLDFGYGGASINFGGVDPFSMFEEFFSGMGGRGDMGGMEGMGGMKGIVSLVVICVKMGCILCKNITTHCTTLGCKNDVCSIRTLYEFT